MTHSVGEWPNAYDVVIVGGGPAGMSAALFVGRALLTTLIVNAEDPRNAATTASHGFLTRDGAHPSDLLRIAKEQLEKYENVQYLAGSVSAVRRTDGGFEVELSARQTVVADRVLIASGYRDELSRLEIVGLEEVHGKSVYPCIFCDGYEHRDERLAVFGGDAAGFYTPVIRRMSSDIIVFTNGLPTSSEVISTLEGRSIPVVQERISQLVSDEGKLRAVELEGGKLIERDAGFIAEDYSVPATTFAQDLGVGTAMNEWGMEGLDADVTGKTKVDGLYVVGDARTGFSGLIASAAEGAACAESIAHEVAAERW